MRLSPYSLNTSHMMISFFLILTTMICSTSCASVPFQTPSKLDKRATLNFSESGIKYEGVGVIKRKSYYTFNVSLPYNTKELVFSNCHREEFYPIKSQSSFQITYRPVTFLENWDSCLSMISAHTASGEREFALIDFSSNETLEAELYCNGGKTAGTNTFCQASEGTSQMIVFNQQVTSKSLTCDTPMTDYGALSGSRFYFEAAKGYCIYAFYTKDKIHRLTVYGY